MEEMCIRDRTNSYYKQIDMDNPSAVAYGDVIEVATAAKNRNGNRYQMVYDENEPDVYKRQGVATPSEATYSYSVKYKDVESEYVLSEVAGNAKKGSTLTIDHLEFDGYDICENQPESFVLTMNRKNVNVYYERQPEVATPSEAQDVYKRQ